ncbi:MAG: ABC transporter ATP-binding protein [Ruminiclostridium sp.]|nr:ABC transporter ATP-binding protein [Ruminiclostridium sp.]
MNIQLENICKIYNSKSDYSVEALRDVTMTINQGDYIAIMGVSGSGKSTLLNIIGCLDRATTGKYTVDGEIIDRLDIYDIRNRFVGFVLQNIGLLPDKTILENVSYPLLVSKDIPFSKIKPMAMKALEKVGIADLADRRAAQTSGGQRQRAAIARAIVGNPEVILADEPTAALDSKTAEDIMELFKGLNKEGRTVVIVTHDKKVAEKCDKIYYVRDGRIAESTETADREDREQ